MEKKTPGGKLPSLNIRNFPEELRKKLKALAAMEGKTLEAMCIEMLQAECERRW